MSRSFYRRVSGETLTSRKVVFVHGAEGNRAQDVVDTIEERETGFHAYAEPDYQFVGTFWTLQQA